MVTAPRSMRKIVLLLTVALCLRATIARSAANKATETVFQSPDGSFEIQYVAPNKEDGDTTIMVVSKANPKEKQLLMTEPDFWGNVWYSSPDSKWLATTVRKAHEVTSMELFRRTEGLKFDKIRDFTNRAWASLSTKRKHTHEEEGIIDFVTWSPDSTRLLIELRGPVYNDANDRPWFTSWSVYFNLQTQQFEYTPYLDWWNLQVFKSPSADDYLDRMALAPASAEPLNDTISEAEWKERQREADRALNETYHQVLATIKAEETADVRSREIIWIKNRDKVADEFVKRGAPPNPALRRLQCLVDATNERTAQLKQDYLNNSASE